MEPSYFEIVTAAAFRWFADVAVDVMVIEVGLLGRWDATNVVDGQVAVVTNVGADHLEYAGPTLVDVATEKSGIVKPGSTLVLGETDPELVAIFRAAGAERVEERGVSFDVLENQLALGGRLLALRTPTSIYHELYLPLHGRHQGDNASAALTAAEAFFDAPLAPGRGGGGLRRGPDARALRGPRPPAPGHRRRRPQPARRGHLRQRPVRRLRPGGQEDPGRRLPRRARARRAMLEALRADEMDAVICCTPSTNRGIPAADVARAARAIGCDDVSYTDDVGDACDAALARAGADDLVLVTGSLYVVGHARPHLLARIP